MCDVPLYKRINILFIAVKQQLLELGEKIGHVNTGLKEDEISRCLRRMKGSVMNDLPLSVNMNVDKKCSICQVSFSSFFIMFHYLTWEVLVL